MRLPAAAEGVGLAHELGERDGKARGRDGQERGVDVIGVGEVRAAALTEDVAQRDLEDRADDLDRDDAEREHGGAAEEGLLFFSSHRKALSRSERFQTGQKKFRKHGGRRLGGLVDLRAGERCAGHAGCGRTPAAMLASSVTPMTSMPQWAATMVSGTVDIPTASAPSTRAARTSAGVSNCGPGKYI